MATFVENTVKDIDAHLSALSEEATRLQAARAALIDGGTLRTPARRRRRRRPAKAALTATPTAPDTRRRPARLSRASSTSTAAATPAAPRPTRARGRRAGGTRANQALELVRKQPGVTIPELAATMQIAPNYLYRVLPKLAADGQVTREDKGWRPAS